MGPSSLSGRTSSTLDLIVTVLEKLVTVLEKLVTVLEKRTRLVLASLAHPASEEEVDIRQSSPLSLRIWSARRISRLDVRLSSPFSLRFWSARQISRLGFGKSQIGP